MLVQCPSCHTTYRLSDNLITAPNPTFRCSRCKHAFVLGLRTDAGPAPKTTVAPPSHAPKEEDRELNFPFPPREAKERTQEDTEESMAPRIAHETSPQPTKEVPPSFPVDNRHNDWSLAPTSPENEEPFTMSKQRQFSQTDSPAQRPLEFKPDWRDSVPAQQESRPVSAAESSEDGPIPTTSCFILCGALLFMFSFLALVHKAQPEIIEGFLKTIPWLSSTVSRNNHLRQGIVLQTLRTRFQRIQGNREVFVVSGVAINRNPAKVREIRVEGHIFGAEGKVLERRITTVGNAVSAKIIRDLTTQEITILQKLTPPKRFELSPEEPTAFVIVFMKSSAQIKSFSCRVLSAEET